MKIWVTIEPDKKEIDSLLFEKQAEGGEGKPPRQKTLLESVMSQAYILMSSDHEVSLKITTMGRDYE